MVVHSYVDNSSNHTPTHSYNRDSPMTGRSPIKASAFHRYTGSRKKKYCVCGRALMWLKDSECWVCGECGHTEYTAEQKRQAPVSNDVSGISSIDGLRDDTNTRPNRGPMRFKSLDARARFLKPRSQLDPELQKLVDEQGVTIIRYEERVVEDNQTLSSEELRQNK